MVRDKVGRLPGELGVNKSMECDSFPFSALTLLVGRQEGHLAYIKLDVGLLVVMI